MHCSSKGNLTNTIAQGSELYDNAQKKLDLSIREYDQAVLDLGHVTASFIAGR